MNNSTFDTCDQYCLFRKNGFWYAILATSVREVAPRPTLTQVHGAHDLLAGLCHWRNEFIPVVHLQDPLAEPPETEDSTLLVVSGPVGSWALLVHEVIGLASLDISLNPDAPFADSWSSVLMGSATYEDQIVQVIDPQGLYRYVQSALQRSWNAVSG